MKKKLLIIIPIILVVIGVSIFFFVFKNKEEVIEKYYLDDEYYLESGISDIEVNDLEKLIKSEESFALFIYLPDCFSCLSFREVLNEYLESNTLTIYSISIAKIKDTDLYKKVKYSPSFVLYKDGEIVTYLDATKDSDVDYYKTSENFNTWLTKYIYLK